MTNVFKDFPPLVAMVVIGVPLITMAQFQSTEQLAAAFAWLIFVAVLLASWEQAIANLSNIAGIKSPGGGGKPGGNKPQ